jgi:hypothetical protein
LEAEACALLFGAKLAAALDLRNAVLLTDNQVVASAVLAGSPRSHLRMSRCVLLLLKCRTSSRQMAIW